MADKILDYSDEIPSFREKRLDVKLIYGRQLSFAPQSVIVPSLRSPNQKNTETPQQSPPSQVQPASPSKTSGTAKPTTPAKKPSPKPQTPGKK
jgi:hypothetical protein